MAWQNDHWGQLKTAARILGMHPTFALQLIERHRIPVDRHSFTTPMGRRVQSIRVKLDAVRQLKTLLENSP